MPLRKKATTIGQAQVRATFRIPRMGTIAGCYVTEGVLRRNAKVRVVRGQKAIFEGEMASLKHHTEDMREVRQGFECGVGVKGFNDFEEGDVLECFIIELVPVA